MRGAVVILAEHAGRCTGPYRPQNRPRPGQVNTKVTMFSGRSPSAALPPLSLRSGSLGSLAYGRLRRSDYAGAPGGSATLFCIDLDQLNPELRTPQLLTDILCMSQHNTPSRTEISLWQAFAYIFG